MRHRTLLFVALGVATSALAALPLGGCTAPGAEEEEGPTTASGESNIEEAADGVFKQTGDLAFKIDAPINQLITRYRNGQADPPKPTPEAGADADAGEDVEPATPGKPDFSEPGHIIIGEKKLDIRMYIRGNTSPRDCTFPKYKIEFTDKKQTKNTPFQGNKKLRVNSHCGTGGPNDRGGQFQRVQNEISPIREELVYRLLRAAGAPTYRTRLAKISYTDTSADSPMAAMDQHGLLIEAGEVAAKRFAEAGLIDKEKGIYINDPTGQPQNSGANATKMKDEHIADAYLAEVLSANMDWYFTVGDPGWFWNIDVFGIPKDGPQYPIIQDFDLAPAVHAMRDPIGEMNAQMDKFRGQFSAKPDVMKASAARFKAHKDDVIAELKKVEKAGIDAGRLPSTDHETTTDPGFVNAHKIVEAFFALPELQ